MKTNNLIIPFLTILFTLMAFVNCQSSNATTTTTSAGTTDTANTVAPTTSASPNKIQQCLEENHCGNDEKCRAKCAGVPDPSVSAVNATNDCVAKCNQSEPQEAYKACVNNCEQIYFPNSTSPTGTAAPGDVSTVNTASATSGPSGSASGSASPSSPSGSSSSTPKPASAATSLRYQPENLYPLMVLVISVVAGMLGVFY